MIKILEHGKYRTVSCGCGCKYSFDLPDVKNSTVKCPECGNQNTVQLPTEEKEITK